jgi:hypothetical protein
MSDQSRKLEEAPADYRGPVIVEVGSVTELTGAGGTRVVDAYGPDGHTANDWNIHNSEAPDEQDPDEE